MTTPSPITNRADYDAAVLRQQQLQREAANNPDKQRELRELTEQLEKYRASNPQETGAANTSQGSQTNPNSAPGNVRGSEK